MKVLGIHIATSQLRYAVVEGTKKSPSLVDKGRLVTVDPKKPAPLMDWFDTEFRALLDRHTPNKISHRLTLAPNKPQLFTSAFPLGILYLLAHQRQLPISDYTARAFTPSKLGLNKSQDLFAYCDTTFGKKPPYWDKNQKYAILAGLFELP